MDFRFCYELHSGFHDLGLEQWDPGDSDYSSELRHGPSIFLLKSEGGGLSLNALDIEKYNFARYLQC